MKILVLFINLLFFTLNVYAIDLEFKNPVPNSGTRTGVRQYGAYVSGAGYHT
ncbi:secreted protein, partial [Candidatus Magnetomorum sp. HK-1]